MNRISSIITRRSRPFVFTGCLRQTGRKTTTDGCRVWFRTNLPFVAIFVKIPQVKRYLNESEQQRLQVIRETYEEAIAAGDKNVYFLDGSRFFDDYNGENATVDGTHPTDLGFTYMAKGIEPLLRQLLK